MKKIAILLGIMGLAALIGFSMAACDHGSSNYNGNNKVPSEIVGEWAAKSDPSVMFLK